MKIGWILDAKSNKWYYNDEHGVMQTGWEQVADKWYYLDISGVMQIGWIQDKGNWYCLYSDGSMMHDITAYGYMFNSNGVATKLS
jgi:N-acetylmuramoyl-L-alanine amidase